MLLENSIIKLRALEPEDLDILYKWENSSTLWLHGNTLAPYSKLALRQYIKDALEMDLYQSKQLRLMICLTEGGHTIGTIDLYDIDAHNRRAGVGILIDKEYRQKGYAKLALDLINEYAFDFLFFNQLYAYISINNKKSITLFKKSGYEETGILKEWIQRTDTFEDVCIYQLLNNKQKE